MNRRESVVLLLALGAMDGLVDAIAQGRAKIRRIGFLSGRLRPASIESTALGGFPQGMRELGYVEDRDFVIEWRFAEGRYQLISELAAELVRQKVDVIVLATPAAVRPLQGMTASIPIVMGYSTDPVGNGFVTSLARPGANVTGLASSADDTSPKHLELLTTVVPRLSRVGLLMNPGNPNSLPVLRGVQASARKAGLTIVPARAQDSSEIGTAFAAFTKERVQAVMIAPDALFNSQLRQISELAIKNRLPSIHGNREFTEAGGLMSYGDSLKEFYRRAASFVDKIFKGAKPADLPVEQPTKFNLVLNLKTAKAIGVAIPQPVLVRADEVIE